MTKNQLFKQNEQLFSKLQIANLANKKLKEENESLKERINILTLQLNAAELNISEDGDIASEDNSNIASEAETESDTEEKNEEAAELPAELPKKEVILSPEMEYGSEIIGEIVMQSVNYSNKISELGKPNKKELINLILGKTEVAKASVLDITLSETAIENKFAMMQSELQSTIEYFKSVLGQ
ncbi:MAG: hypothetical protein KBS52_05850 [Clostridiales bacterium]|nr:hypothetical protein [Candidatus Equinaster intestinalis]